MFFREKLQVRDLGVVWQRQIFLCRGFLTRKKNMRFGSVKIAVLFYQNKETHTSRALYVFRIWEKYGSAVNDVDWDICCVYKRYYIMENEYQHVVTEKWETNRVEWNVCEFVNMVWFSILRSVVYVICDENGNTLLRSPGSSRTTAFTWSGFLAVFWKSQELYKQGTRKPNITK